MYPSLFYILWAIFLPNKADIKAAFIYIMLTLLVSFMGNKTETSRNISFDSNQFM